MSVDGRGASTPGRVGSRLPNFLVIGAMKAGTTSLYEYLRHHPQVFMPDIKEVNFFNPLRNWRRGVEWYEQRFSDAGPGAVAVGEASTSYTKFPWIDGVPARIASVLGSDVRLIYVVRDPVERMRSQYLHHTITGQERRPIERALVEDEMYLNISRYAMQLERYRPYVADDHVLIVDSRDLRHRRSDTLRLIFGFLEVDPKWVAPTMDQEFLRSDDRRMKAPTLRRIRRIPRIRTIATYVPGPVKRLKRGWSQGLATQALDVEAATISDELRERLVASLRDDVAALRSVMPAGFDGWGIA
ncbi:MAG: sulfotransferase domain-containing protein [Actinomycetota bacterium]